MANLDLTMPAARMAENITVNVTVTGLKVFRARWWVARWLLVLAARIAGCGIHVDVQQTGGW